MLMSVLIWFVLYLLASVQSDMQKLRELTNIHAVILARGGSKGIKNKNLQRIDGISLLGRTILTINSTKAFQNIWVSTDNKQIEEEARKYGAVVHIRPKKYAEDETPSIVSIKEFLRKHPTITQIGLFQCTSVFLNRDYIKEALWKFKKRDCVFAVKINYYLRWKYIDGFIQPINFKIEHRPRRQDWNGELVETGMFYFTTRSLVDDNKLQNDRCDVVEIRPEDSLEIDSPSDLTLARCISKG